MSYRRDGDQVTITITHAQFQQLMLLMGWRAGEIREPGPITLKEAITLANAINEGNPNWKPYAVERKEGTA
jgi:hypothetical protein